MRDYSVEWAAVWAAAYLSMREGIIHEDDAARDDIAEDAAATADQAIAALHRVRGQEASNG